MKGLLVNLSNKPPWLDKIDESLLFLGSFYKRKI